MSDHDRIPETFTTDDLAHLVRWLQRRLNEGGTPSEVTTGIAEHIATELDAREASPSLRADAWMLVNDLHEARQDDGPR